MEDAVAWIEGRARSHGLVVLAGAGVSAGPPASLPSWKPLCTAILRALSARAEAIRGRPGWLAEVAATVKAHRDSDRLPPEYQAQLIHEMCGERYFRALQCLDVSTWNESHDAIAALVATGRVRTIVTTNFDPLIERALERRGIAFTRACDEAGFAAMAAAGPAEDRAPVRILKIHGCVSDHRSMIDTLKQRRLGRSAALTACLDGLHAHAWLYLGFSAADLEGDESYLGLRSGAERSPGGLYVAWPGAPGLSKGATVLMDAYGDRGRVVPAEVAEAVGRIAVALGGPAPVRPDDMRPAGPALVEAALARWAGSLTPAAVALGLGAVLEAVGEADAAVHILDRFVRHEIVGPDREDEDYRALQLHYGRMGAALGRFVAVPDLNGAASNASVESVQSLLRLFGTELEFAACGLAACAWLWLGNGESARQTIYRGGAGEPRTPEESIDAWIAIAQVAVVAADVPMAQMIVDTAARQIAAARRAGDPVRAARAGAMYVLVLAETSEDVPALVEAHRDDFTEAARVGDGFAQAFRALALGRWHVGPGGLARASAGVPTAEIASQALEHLAAAATLLARQGMDPWLTFAQLQQAKAFADLGQVDDTQRCVDAAAASLDRFPIWRSHVLETVGQVTALWGSLEEAAPRYRAAIAAAAESGLPGRVAILERHPAVAER